MDGARLRVLDHAGNVLMSDEEVAEAEAARAADESARADAAEAELRRLKARYGIVEEE